MRKKGIRLVVRFACVFFLCAALLESGCGLDRAPVIEKKPPSLILAGDVMFCRRIEKWSKEYDKRYPFCPDTVKILKDADLVFANLESPFGTGGSPLPYKGIWFKADPSFASRMKHGGINVVSLANNHILDYDIPVFLQTMEILKENGIAFAGGGKNTKEAATARIIDIKEKKIAFLAYSELAEIYWDIQNPRSFLAAENRPGILPIDLKLIGAEMARIRKKVDYIVVSLHWGNEYEHYPTRRQRKIAHRILEMGADVIAGHHPHVIQGIEYYHHKLIFYSLGNFIFDQTMEDTDETMIVKIIFSERPILQIFPMVIDKGRPRPAQGRRALEILRKIKKYSSPLSILPWPEENGEDRDPDPMVFYTLFLDSSRRAW